MPIPPEPLYIKCIQDYTTTSYMQCPCPFYAGRKYKVKAWWRSKNRNGENVISFRVTSSNRAVTSILSDNPNFIFPDVTPRNYLHEY